MPLHDIFKSSLNYLSIDDADLSVEDSYNWCNLFCTVLTGQDNKRNSKTNCESNYKEYMFTIYLFRCMVDKRTG